MPTIKQRLEENIALACMTFAVTGFGVGFAADRTIIERANQVVVVKDSFVPKQEVQSNYIQKSTVDSEYIPKTSLIGYGDGGCEARGQLVDQVAYNSASRDIESRLAITSHKGHGGSGEGSLPRLKRAVFQSVSGLNASSDVLKGALDQLALIYGSAVTDNRDVVLADFSRLLRVRYRWLTEEVRPALNRVSAGHSDIAQDAPMVDVDMPPEFDILPGKRGKENFSDPALTSEIDLLKARLTSR